jgi:O-glycosyl hydrolase
MQGTVTHRLLLLSSLLLLFSSALPAQSAEKSVLHVHPELTAQTITGFGAGFNDRSLAWFSAIASPAERERAYDMLYGDHAGARLNIVRLKVSPDAAPSDASGQHYNWAGDQRTQLTWQAIQPVLRRGHPLLYAVPFTPPARWKMFSPPRCPERVGCLDPAHDRDYANYLADFVEYYHKTLGADLDAVSIQNEPGVAAPWDACLWSGDQMRDFLKVFAATLRQRGLNTRIMSSEGTAWAGAWAHLVPTLADNETRHDLGIMASHSYGPLADPAANASRQQFAAASSRNGLPVWMSEMSLMPPYFSGPDDPSMDAAILVARYMHRDLTLAHASAWIYCFAIFTAKFPGSLGLLAPADSTGTLSLPKRFWALANYSRFVRPGWKLIEINGSGPESSAFVSPQGDRFVVVTINETAQPRQTVYEFGSQQISSVESWTTSAELDLARTTSPKTEASNFTATVAPRSVTTFVVSTAR